MQTSTANRVIATSIVALTGTAFAADLRSPDSFASIGDRSARSRALFEEAGKVLQHPRCLNCHPVGERPTQGNDMHLHQPMAVRGTDGHGVVGMQCHTCHQVANFDAVRSARKPTVAPGTGVDGVAEPVARRDLRADQRPPTQWRQDPRGDARAHGARFTGRMGLGARWSARTGSGHSSAIRRADQGLDRHRRGVPATLTQQFDWATPRRSCAWRPVASTL